METKHKLIGVEKAISKTTSQVETISEEKLINDFLDGLNKIRKFLVSSTANLEDLNTSIENISWKTVRMLP